MPAFLDHFRLIAPHYDRIFTFLKADRLKEILQLSQDGWLLDAGGGTGRVAQMLRDVTSRVVVMDESEGMLRQARDKGLIAVRGEVEALPFRSDALPHILMVDAFHHLRDQAASVAELLRTLAPEGRLVLEEPDIGRPIIKLIALGEKLLLMRSRFRTPESVQRMFEAAGGRVRLRREEANFWAVVEKSG